MNCVTKPTGCTCAGCYVIRIKLKKSRLVGFIVQQSPNLFVNTVLHCFFYLSTKVKQ